MDIRVASFEMGCLTGSVAHQFASLACLRFPSTVILILALSCQAFYVSSVSVSVPHARVTSTSQATSSTPGLSPPSWYTSLFIVIEITAIIHKFSPEFFLLFFL